MTVDEQQDLLLRVDKKIHDGANVMFENFDNIENNLYDLFLIAPAVFDEEMTKSLLLDYKALEQLMGNFETAYSQVSSPVDISQAIFIDILMKRLDKLFERCISYIYKCNEMVGAYNFDVGKVQLLEKLNNNFNYEIVHWKDLDNAFDNPYLVARTSDVLEETYDNDYYPLHTLRIKGFKDKTSAYRYMLENGIPRSNLILRY